MRTNLIFIFSFLCFVSGAISSAKAQVLFEVPNKIQFAGLDLYLDEGAKQIVRQHGQGLVKNPKFYRQMTERADAYFPIVEKVFAEEGLPNDFKYLCIQESGLVSNVVSSSKAVGYWQFKAETATDVGMRVDDQIDERMHIVSSSRGAAKYLKKNNQYMNNWVTNKLFKNWRF
jgi:membrane-bound lytic murein transglycosylase D